MSIPVHGAPFLYWRTTIASQQILELQFKYMHLRPCNPSGPLPNIILLLQEEFSSCHKKNILHDICIRIIQIHIEDANHTKHGIHSKCLSAKNQHININTQWSTNYITCTIQTCYCHLKHALQASPAYCMYVQHSLK